MLGLYKSNLSVVQNGQIKSYLKYVQNKGGGVKSTFGKCPKERRFFGLDVCSYTTMFSVCWYVMSLLPLVKYFSANKSKITFVEQAQDH